MKLPILTAAGGAAWEAGLVVSLETHDHGVAVVRRCVDTVDLLAVAVSGQARAALIEGGLRRLDADAVDRLHAAGVVPVGVLTRGDGVVEQRLRAMGFEHLVPAEAAPAVVASVIAEAVREYSSRPTDERGTRGFASTGALTVPARSIMSSDEPATGAGGGAGALAAGDGAVGAGPPARRGSVVAVWGPTGAPGRSTVAVTLADELARLGRSTLLIDLDVYGGVLAAMLGLLDESPGFAAACRQAGTRRLSTEALAALSWQLTPQLRVLTGIPRADRWPELRTPAVGPVLDTARELADFIILDCGFCLESDEELSFDMLAPRRNGVTLAALDLADVVLAVGSADPMGIQRLVRGLAELRDVEVTAPIWVVLNRVRREAVPGEVEAELGGALERFAGRAPAALLPLDQSGTDAALAVGKTLGEVRPDSPLRAAVVELAHAVAGTPRHARRRRGR